MGSTGRNWEGLGGPVRVDRANLNDIDPSLDECCQREEESNRKGNALRRTLQRYDVVSEKERRRRQLVNTTNFSGCRCCYDPNSDGGEYLALIELRTSRKQKEEDAEETEHQAMEEKKKDDTVDVASDPSDDEFDYLLDEELPGQGEKLKALEDLRRAELEMSIFSREVALSHGYGTHRQMHPTRVLKAAGLAPGTRDPSPAVVLHLVDPDSIASASLDLYLEELAQKEAKGTKFLRSGGRSTLLMDAELATKVLPRLKPEKDMPAMVAIRDGVATNVCPRLQGLTDRDGQVVTRAVFEWLDRCGVLLEHPPLLEAVCRIRPEEEALMDCLTSPKPTPPEEPRFDCGVHECCKTFPHEHIGIQNEQQDGLVISEADVVG